MQGTAFVVGERQPAVTHFQFHSDSSFTRILSLPHSWSGGRQDIEGEYRDTGLFMNATLVVHAQHVEMSETTYTQKMFASSSVQSLKVIWCLCRGEKSVLPSAVRWMRVSSVA